MLAVALPLLLLHAAAAEPHGDDVAHEQEHAPHPNLIELKGVGAAAFTEHGPLFLFGPGLAYERELDGAPLAMELSIAELFGEGHQVTPFDVILKTPFHLSDHLEVFAGAGPSVTVDVHGGRVAVHPGIALQSGALFELEGGLGVVAELDYCLALERPGHVVHEAMAAAGVVRRF
jgi:hypothetical protein